MCSTSILWKVLLELGLPNYMATKTLRKENRNEGTIIMSTFPKRNILSTAARKLILDKHLCACVNIIKINSLYLWKDKLEVQEEYLALFKSTRNQVPALKYEIKKIHPYEVPEIVELKTNKFSEEYASWLNSVTSDSTTTKKRQSKISAKN